jgi:hypothetical protein
VIITFFFVAATEPAVNPDLFVRQKHDRRSLPPGFKVRGRDRERDREREKDKDQDKDKDKDKEDDRKEDNLMEMDEPPSERLAFK